MGCQKHIAEVIIDKGADYVFSLKGNQGRLQNGVELFFQEQRRKICHAVRNHWGIENSLHWVLDVTFREDESRIRKDNAPENFAVLRHIALNMIKRESTLKKSIKSKRLRAGWDNAYLLKVLAG